MFRDGYQSEVGFVGRIVGHFVGIEVCLMDCGCVGV